MKKLIELSNTEASEHFLKGSSYFNLDFPHYIDFSPILKSVALVLNHNSFRGFQSSSPDDVPGVNYNFISNKDGKFAWRPLELIHPAIYVSLINTICKKENWSFIVERFKYFQGGSVDCCSAPVMSLDEDSDKAKQVTSWWHEIEQKSLKYSLRYSHILHTDVTNCYGAIYTHSISWALHGIDESKKRKLDTKLLGNKIDSQIRAGRYGQTNGISQSSVLMDFIAELVLGFVDTLISENLPKSDDFQILRYRDDYRIFANSDEQLEIILKVVSENLRKAGMSLSVPKTHLIKNVVSGSIKPDKLAGIELNDLGKANAETIQKQLLRLHSFGLNFPNSGALRRLITEYHTNILLVKRRPDDLEVLIGIATDIGFVSPSTFPVVAAILSHLISLSSPDEKKELWEKVKRKMQRVPNNGYLQIWLQRVIKPKAVGIAFESEEAICRIVDGEKQPLWNNEWIESKVLIKALDVLSIITNTPAETKEVVQPEEVALFAQNAWAY